MRAERELDWFALVDRLRIATDDTNAELRQRRLEKLYTLAVREADVKFKITEPTFWRHKEHQPGEVIEDVVGPYRHAPGAGGLVHTAQFEEIAEERRAILSAIDRIKEKALRARGVAPKQIAAFEADLDGIIAEEPKLEADRANAVGKHTAAFKGIREQFDGLNSAIDILSNGGPELVPLHESETK